MGDFKSISSRMRTYFTILLLMSVIKNVYLCQSILRKDHGRRFNMTGNGTDDQMEYDDCSLIEKCPAGEVCVRTGYALNCKKYAKGEEKCSDYDGNLEDIPVFSIHPPCDPTESLQCNFDGTQEICVKQSIPETEKGKRNTVCCV